MSIYAYQAVWDESEAQGPARIIMLAIADSANRDTGEATVAIGTIAEMTRLAPSTVRAHCRDLEDAGELVLLRKGGGRGNHPKWRVNLGRYKPAASRRDYEELNPPPPGGIPDDKPAGNPPETRREPAEQPAGIDPDTISRTLEPPALPTERLARRWCELRNLPQTPPLLRRFVGQIREFLDASDAIPTDDWIRAAADAGIREPSGWGAYAIRNPVRSAPDPDVLAANEARVAAARERAIADAPTATPEQRERIQRLLGGLADGLGEEMTG